VNGAVEGVVVACFVDDRFMELGELELFVLPPPKPDEAEAKLGLPEPNLAAIRAFASSRIPVCLAIY